MRKTWLWYAIAIGSVVVSLALSWLVVDVQTRDYDLYVKSWVDTIRERGGIALLSQKAYDYTPIYMYLLTISLFFFKHLSNLFVIKIIAVAINFVCAYFAYRIVALKYRDPLLPIVAFALVLNAPTVFMNGAYWGQSDISYTTCAIASLYFAMIRRPLPAMIAYGLAFALKLQSIFFAPFILILLLKRRVSWREFLAIPLVYCVAIIPAWIGGHPLGRLLTVYARQTQDYSLLTLNAPNMYQWWPDDQYATLYPISLALALTVILGFVWFVWKKIAMETPEAYLIVALLSVLIVPFFIPKAHERYFLPADILAIVLAFYRPRFWYVAALITLASIISAIPELFGVYLFPLWLPAIWLLALIAFLLDYLRRIDRNAQDAPPQSVSDAPA